MEWTLWATLSVGWAAAAVVAIRSADRRQGGQPVPFLRLWPTEEQPATALKRRWRTPAGWVVLALIAGLLGTAAGWAGLGEPHAGEALPHGGGDATVADGVIRVAWVGEAPRAAWARFLLAWNGDTQTGDNTARINVVHIGTEPSADILLPSLAAPVGGAPMADALPDHQGRIVTASRVFRGLPADVLNRWAQAASLPEASTRSPQTVPLLVSGGKPARPILTAVVLGSGFGQFSWHVDPLSAKSPNDEADPAVVLLVARQVRAIAEAKGAKPLRDFALAPALLPAPTRWREGTALVLAGLAGAAAVGAFAVAVMRAHRAVSGLR